MELKEQIRNFFRPKQIHINSDTVSKEVMDRALHHSYIEAKAEIDQWKNKYMHLRKSTDAKEEEEDVKIYLNLKKQRLESVKSTKYFSFKQFFNDINKNKKLAGNLFFTDFDRKTKISKFKDIGLSEQGQLVVAGEDGVILSMFNAKDIFGSVGGLGNDVASGMIPLNLDESGSWIENIMATDVPELQRNGRGLQYYKARKKPVYEILSEKNQIISEQQNEIEDKDEIIAEQSQDIDDKARALRINNKLVESITNDMSMMEKEGTGVTTSFHNLSRRLQRSENKFTIVEEAFESLEKELDKMRNKAEREGTKIGDEKAREIFEQTRATIMKNMPDKEIIVVDKTSQPQKIEAKH